MTVDGRRLSVIDSREPFTVVRQLVLAFNHA
jgi:hypothetical protein